MDDKRSCEGKFDSISDTCDTTAVDGNMTVKLLEVSRFDREECCSRSIEQVSVSTKEILEASFSTIMGNRVSSFTAMEELDASSACLSSTDSVAVCVICHKLLTQEINDHTLSCYQ